MTSRIRRREFVAGLGVSLLAAPAIVRAEGEPILIRAGALKLIHSIAPYFYDQFVPAGYKVEVLPFETPTAAAQVTSTPDVAAKQPTSASVAVSKTNSAPLDEMEQQVIATSELGGLNNRWSVGAKGKGRSSSRERMNNPPALTRIVLNHRSSPASGQALTSLAR